MVEVRVNLNAALASCLAMLDLIQRAPAAHSGNFLERSHRGRSSKLSHLPNPAMNLTDQPQSPAGSFGCPQVIATLGGQEDVVLNECTRSSAATAHRAG
jgi:hypothetical protein